MSPSAEIIVIFLWCLFGLFIVGLVAALVWSEFWPEADRPARPEPPKSERPPLRTCPGCGDIYHRSWGVWCPNCSGAD